LRAADAERNRRLSIEFKEALVVFAAHSVRLLAGKKRLRAARFDATCIIQ